MAKEDEHKQRIGYFGGAFSPVHDVHVDMVRRTIPSTVDLMIIVPATDVYALRKPGILPAPYRISLLRERFKNCSNVIISLIDVEKDYFPDALDTAHEVEESFPGNLIWIMGGDRLHWMENNLDMERILKEYPFLVFERQPYIESLLRKHPSVKNYQHQLQFKPGWSQSVSSTEIRKQQRIGEYA